MFEIKLLNNKTGQSFTKEYKSYYTYQQDLKKYSHSISLTILSYGKI